MSSFDAHPAALFFQHELPFSLSCDNLLLSGNDLLRPTPSNEVLHLAREVVTAKKDKMENNIEMTVFIEALLCLILRNFNIYSRFAEIFDLHSYNPLTGSKKMESCTV